MADALLRDWAASLLLRHITLQEPTSATTSFERDETLPHFATSFMDITAYKELFLAFIVEESSTALRKTIREGSKSSTPVQLCNVEPIIFSGGTVSVPLIFSGSTVRGPLWWSQQPMLRVFVSTDMHSTDVGSNQSLRTAQTSTTMSPSAAAEPTGVSDWNNGARMFVQLRNKGASVLGICVSTIPVNRRAHKGRERGVIHRLVVSQHHWDSFCAESFATDANKKQCFKRQRTEILREIASAREDGEVEDDYDADETAGDVVVVDDDSPTLECVFLHSAVTVLRECAAVLGCEKIHAQLLAAILHPAAPTLGPSSTEKVFTYFTHDALSAFMPGGAFARHLSKGFNVSQQAAIRAATKSVGFTLIQGPPGTGKTVTIVGVLNALHVLLYTMYYELVMGTEKAKKLLALSEENLPAEAAPAPVIVEFVDVDAAAPPVVVAVVLDSDESTSFRESSKPIGKLSHRLPPAEAAHAGAELLRQLAPLGPSVVPRYNVAPVIPSVPAFGSLKVLLYSASTEEALHIAAQRRMKPRILVTAPSNTAIDGVMERLLKLQFVDARPAAADIKSHTYLPTVVRVGEAAGDFVRKHNLHLETEVNKYMSLTLADCDALMQRLRVDKTAVCSSLQDIRNRWTAHAEDEATFLLQEGSLMLQLVSKFTAVEAKLRRVNAVSDFHHDHRQQRHSERFVSNSLLEDADIIFSTTSSASLSVLEQFTSSEDVKFDAVLIDEAAQAVEPSALIPLLYGCSKCVLVGDPMQLPATIMSKRAAEAGYDISLLGRLMKAGHPYNLLSEQYRCHPSISAFPFQRFYGTAAAYDGVVGGHRVVGDASSVLEGRRSNPMHTQPCFSPFLFYAMQTEASKVNPLHDPICGVDCRSVSLSSQSQYNVNEIEFVVHLIRTLSNWRSDPVKVPSSDATVATTTHRRVKFSGTLGVITFYRNQMLLLRHILRQLFPPKTAASGGIGVDFSIDVNTVDGFQGQERDCIIVSCVRCDKSSIGFLADPRRITVALTRAKYACWVIGHPDTLAASDDWKALLEFQRERGQIMTVSSVTVDLLSLRLARASADTEH